MVNLLDKVQSLNKDSLKNLFNFEAEFDFMCNNKKYVDCVFDSCRSDIHNYTESVIESLKSKENEHQKKVEKFENCFYAELSKMEGSIKRGKAKIKDLNKKICVLNKKV